jgi:hypothetical protein
MALSKRQRATYTRYAIYTLSILAVGVMVLLVDWTRLSNAMFKWEIVK